MSRYKMNKHLFTHNLMYSCAIVMVSCIDKLIEIRKTNKNGHDIEDK